MGCRAIGRSNKTRLGGRSECHKKAIERAIEKGKRFHAFDRDSWCCTQVPPEGNEVVPISLPPGLAEWLTLFYNREKARSFFLLASIAETKNAEAAKVAS